MDIDDIGLIPEGSPDEQGERCGACSEGFEKRCVYYAGHAEPLHKFADQNLPWPPAYFATTEDEKGNAGNESYGKPNKKKKEKENGRKKPQGTK